MTALRLLLALALVAAAKATLADRVVPEEQFYNQATEQEFANEQSLTDATRSTLDSTEHSSFGSIGDLLNNLITNIGNEQTACDTQTAARALCEKTHVDELKRLTDDAITKRGICTAKTDFWQGKKNVMDQEQDFNNMITAQLKQASASMAYINTHSAVELSECEANAGASFERASGYINDAHATNQKYLDEAEAMVASIETQVAELQSGTGG